MTSKTHSQWGMIPGDTKMEIERQFTFYNFENPEDFVFRGKKPHLQESKKFYFQEFQEFNNPQFSEDQTKVDFDYYQYFHAIKQTNAQEIQNCVNLGPLSFWYQLKLASETQIGIQGNDTLDNNSYYAALQWSQQGISNNPPIGDKIESITSTNTTTIGFPEISFFLQKYLPNHISNDTKYQNLKFTNEWAEKIMEYIENPVNYTIFIKTNYSLLNQGNLKILYSWGKQFEQTQNETYLQLIADRFLISEYYQDQIIDRAFVFWKYCIYIVNEFAEMRSKGGNQAYAGLGGIGRTKIQQIFLDENISQFKDFYMFQEPAQVLDYIRYMVIFTGFGGLTIKNTAYNYLFGYEDPFLINLKYQNPQQGGDPSISLIVNYNDLNMSDPTQAQKQGMYTGKENIKQVRQYYQINQFPYVTINKQIFDGFQVSNQLVSPWDENIQIQGTDAGANEPDLDEDSNLNIFINTLYQGGQLYNYDYNNTLNLTSILSGPIFNTKTHMLNIDPDMTQFIDVYNTDGNPQYPSNWDQTFILVEPITVMIPFFYVHRSGNLTEDAPFQLQYIF
ncbi:hypothetical protein IMG5_098570 [Ichthyophthirius multifiliis]|uniref:Uncharacterized protein n=1 Tax=Ichthyophthirius multifiliis TaxID=5932 RepID=G0QRZ1_ICHMU|nr:hypothetical protein IMG5_098570 [Ichthyophthirius multifiliis]EGR32021.1 hypothetical protein IMG5_098570 [Ichthyophthirius multifiliis]|eukprot:XP_004035507.1 hypothetical protein IMG5_098570 [Ichthyophthirius multifiliis]